VLQIKEFQKNAIQDQEQYKKVKLFGTFDLTNINLVFHKVLSCNHSSVSLIRSFLTLRLWSRQPSLSKRMSSYVICSIFSLFRTSATIRRKCGSILIYRRGKSMSMLRTCLWVSSIQRFCNNLVGEFSKRPTMIFWGLCRCKKFAINMLNWKDK
jgi:hypothetical protein